MQHLKLFLDEFSSLVPFLTFWQAMIITQGVALDYFKRSDYFSLKKTLLLNFYFSIPAMMTIVLGYSIIVVKPMLHIQMLMVLAILSVFNSILLYRFKIYLYGKFDCFPKQPKLVTFISVGLILLPGIIYLFIALMIGGERS